MDGFGVMGLDEPPAPFSVAALEVKAASFATKAAGLCLGLLLSLLDQLTTSLSGPVQACQDASLFGLADLIFIIWFGLLRGWQCDGRPEEDRYHTASSSLPPR